MNRRGFLGTILALGAAPAICRASSLMVLPTRRLVVAQTIDPAAIEELKRWGTLRFYDGSPDDPLAKVLGEMPIEDWKPAKWGTIEANTPGMMTFTRTGIASMFAIERADGERVITGQVGTPEAPGDLNLSMRSATPGQLLALTVPPTFGLGEDSGIGLCLSEAARNRMLDEAMALPEALRKP